VTAAGTERGTGLGIHVVYPSLIYEIHLMSHYFAAFGDVWTSCLRLAWYRNGLKGEPIQIVQQRTEGSSGRPSEPARPPIFRVQRLHIGSPMVTTFAVEGGLTAITVYAAFLMVRVLGDPERIGAWLPRLVVGWHKTMYEAEMRRYERRDLSISRGLVSDIDDEEPFEPMTERDVQQLPEVRELIKASQQLLDLHMQPDEVSIIGADEAPEDLAAADEPDEPER
jgi:hypothetical protein